MTTTFTPDDVTAYEHDTWSRCAPGYRDGFELLTSEAIDPLLDAADVTRGSNVLDVGTGPGTVAAVAVGRGATTTGIDFAEPMLTEARRAVPQADFRLAAADALPFERDRFDAVVANVVLHHLAHPDAALREAHRVLVSGGRVACTVWGDVGSLDAFGLFFGAVEEHAGGAELPHGPLFGVTDPDTLTALFTDAGFGDVIVETLPTTWRLPSVEPFLRAFSTWAQLDTFPSEVRAAIERSVRANADQYVQDAGLAIANPMVLVSARKPS